MGSSRHWQDAFEVITGQRKMDAGPLLEYFQPLMDWLSEENNRTAEHIGWQHHHKGKHLLMNWQFQYYQVFQKNHQAPAIFLRIQPGLLRLDRNVAGDFNTFREEL